MSHIVEPQKRFQLNGLVAIFWLIIVGSSLAACANEKAVPVVVPYEGAPLTAAVDGKFLIVANNSDDTIYLRIFPTDILPAIEWAPCIAPEACPADQRIDPGSEKRVNLQDIVREQTVSITVFWWIYLEKVPGSTVPPMEMDEITVPLP